MRPKKHLGQHFLTDERVARRIVARADPGEDDVVLEIGPGKGVLTRHLATRAREVMAVEVDPDLARALQRDMPENVRLLTGDALKVEWPPFDLCVSNLPYQISSPVTFRLLEHAGWREAVLMYQREFAERMRAAPATPEYGRLTVAVAHAADVEYLKTVPPGAFFPPPKVESAVVRLTPRPAPFHVKDVALFHEVLRAAFAHRRKRLVNALKSGIHLISGPEIAERLPHVPHGDRRPGELTPAEFADVANALAG